MELLVNDEPYETDIEAEEMKSLAEYIKELDEEFAEVNRVIHSIEVDGENFTRDVDEKLAALNCGEVDKLELKVQPMDKMAIDSIANLGEYCQSFLARLPDVVEDWGEKEEDQKKKHRQEVSEALNIARGILSSVTVILNMPSEKLSDLQERAGKLEEKVEEADFQKLGRLLREECREFIEDLLAQLREYMDALQVRKEDARDSARQIDKLIDEILERLPGLVDNLQGGETDEQVGLEEIEELAGKLEIILNRVSKLDDQGEIKKNLDRQSQGEMVKSQEQLTVGLQELEKALEDRDLIMICDILEYEIKPYLEGLKPIFQDSNK